MSGAGASIREAIGAILASNPGVADGRTVIALGWATVDADRAAAQLAERWPGCAPFVPIPGDDLLGASCLASSGVPDEADDGDGPAARLVLLEPTTEGRLAGWLARHDEGPAALWLTGRDDGSGAAAQVENGPFGPERLLSGGPGRGPHLLLADRSASTIHR